MRARASVQVEEAVAVGAQVAAYVAQDDGRGLTVVVVVTHGLHFQDGDVKRLFRLIGSRTRLLTLFDVSHHLLLLSVFAHPAP